MHKAREGLANMERRHFIIACVIVVAAAVAIVGATVIFVANTWQKQAQTTTQNFDISGEMVCLPHKNTDGPQTLECAYGLRTDDNRYYSLQLDPFPTDIQTGERIRVKGVLTTGTHSIYDIVGSIKVSEVTRP